MTVFADRRDALFDRLQEETDAVLLTPGPNLLYLTGYQFERTAWGEESPFCCLLHRDREPATVLPELEVERAGDSLPGRFFTYTDDGASPSEAFDDLVADYDLTGPVGVDFSTMRLQEYFHLPVGGEAVFDIIPAVSDLRARKDDCEIEYFREAARISDEVLGATLENLSPGMEESTVEALLKVATLESDADDFGSGVVTSGPRTAINYTETTDRRIEEDDVVLIDMGVVYKGYYTDVTRTVLLGEPQSPLPEVHDVVGEAAAAARSAARPGMTADELDSVARKVVEDAGYGDAFVHGLGHGIGLDSHEAPVLDQGNETVLEAGNVVTIEPGIYLDGIGGVRIEDDVVLTEDGATVLTQLPRTPDGWQ